MKRAEKLDSLRSKHISEKLTLEEAKNIVQVWGAHLEYFGGVRILFGIDIPESLLPYPIAIIQGALNKMEAYYYEQEMHDKVKLLEGTEMELISYTNDEEATRDFLVRFGNKEIIDAIISGLKNYQQTQAEAGYLIDKKIWKLSRSRIEELESDK